MLSFFFFARSGPSCSKLTTSFVNVSLRFQTLISEIYQYFLLKKCEQLLQCKNSSHLQVNIKLFSKKMLGEGGCHQCDAVIIHVLCFVCPFCLSLDSFIRLGIIINRIQKHLHLKQ